MVCIKISGYGNDTKLQVTLSKNGGGTFSNDINLSLYSPYTGKSSQYGCLSTSGKSTYSVDVYPSDFGISLGETIAINAQAFSPCSGGSNYISDDAYVSQCSD